MVRVRAQAVQVVEEAAAVVVGAVVVCLYVQISRALRVQGRLAKAAFLPLFEMIMGRTPAAPAAAKESFAQSCLVRSQQKSPEQPVQPGK